MIVRRICAVLLVVTLVILMTTVATFASAWDDYPTPTPSPDPYASPTPSPQIIWYNEQTPPPVTSVNASVAFYYVKFLQSTTYTADRYYTVDGTLVTAPSSSNFRLSDYIPCSGAETIALYSRSTSRFVNMRTITFFDSDKNVILGSNFDDYVAGTTEWHHVPGNAAFVRVSLTTVNNIINSNAFYRVGICPSNVHVNDPFWFDFFQPNSFFQTEDGNVILSVDAPNFAFDEFCLDVRFGNGYLPAHNFSGLFNFTILDGGSGTTYYPLEYNDLREQANREYPYLYTYYVDGSGQKQYSDYYSSSSGIPFTANAQISNGYFSGFVLHVPCNKPTGYLANSLVSVVMSNLKLDDKSVVITQVASNALDELSHMGDALAMPSPNSDAILNELDAINDRFSNSDFSDFNWFGGNDGIFTTMCVTVVLFACLGYIFFGKMS